MGRRETLQSAGAALVKPDLVGNGGAFTWLAPSEPAGPGPLHGWPLAVKDLIAVAGHPTGAGSAAFADADPQDRDAEIVRALREAGATLVGTTALHELAFGVTGVNEYGGTPANPHDPTRIPGGSSSGSAVAVADGSARVALGTDTGGSIRIPAALCGVVGFKPAHGEYPTAGVLELAPTLDHVGALTRNVSDMLIVHEVVTGTGPGARPERLGLVTAWFETAEPSVAAAVETAIRATDLPIVEVHDLEAEAVFEASTTILLYEAARVHAALIDEAADLLGESVRARLESGTTIDDKRYEAALQARRRMRDETHARLESVPILVGPAVPVVAPRLASAGDPNVSRSLVANTRLANLTGLPAISVPVCTSADGRLPAGIQVMAATSRSVLAAAELVARHV